MDEIDIAFAHLNVDATKARIYFSNGRVVHYEDQKLAYFLWFALPKGVRAACRGANDTQPVYPWDYADALAAEGP
jgi:hypothetical protein